MVHCVVYICSDFSLQLKKEICEAHGELRALYEELRSSRESLDSVEVDVLEPNQEPSSDFKPGSLTTFVKSFRDVLEEMVRDNSTRTTVSFSENVLTFGLFGRKCKFGNMDCNVLVKAHGHPSGFARLSFCFGTIHWLNTVF